MSFWTGADYKMLFQQNVPFRNTRSFRMTKRGVEFKVGVLGNRIFVPVPVGGHFFEFFCPPNPYDFAGNLSKIIGTGDFSHGKNFRGAPVLVREFLFPGVAVTTETATTAETVKTVTVVSWHCIVLRQAKGGRGALQNRHNRHEV